jgi:hypothetical protein
MKIGRALGTALVGLFFMLFLAVDLVLFGVVALDSIVITALLVIGLVGGAVVGWLVGARSARPVAATVATGSPPPPPPAPPASPPPRPPPPPPPI